VSGAVDVSQIGTLPSNEHVHDGDEASFGSCDADEATHGLAHHVTRDLLVSKELPRIYQVTEDGHLIYQISAARRTLVSY
jgi:hypothetical protein